MPALECSWTWTLESALHVGSGISRAGRADALVQRDDQGRPVLTGEAVKGALRMGAEHVAAWLEERQHYEKQGTTEPRSDLFRWLFGSTAGARFTPGAFVAGPTEPIVVSSTAIDPSSGTAATGTLRSVEVWPQGLQFRVTFSLDRLEAGCIAVARSFFLAALASAESIGGRAGVGWGQLGVSDICFYGTNHPNEVQLEDDLNKARAYLKQGQDDVCASPADHPIIAKPLVSPTWYEFEIDLLEPACFPVDPAVSNEVATEGGLRATALRGAFGAYWTRSGSEATVRDRLSEFTRWSPGFPVARVNGNCHWCGPVPRSLARPKRGGSALYDGFDRSEDEKIPLKAAAVGWVYAQHGQPTSWGEGQTMARMHVARNYTTGSKQSGALFAKESLIPGGRFRSWALLEAGVWNARDEFQIRLGRRTSTGNGLAKVTVTAVGPPPPTSGTSDQAHVTIQLLSPAIVLDDNGHPRARLDTAGLIRLLSKHFDAATVIESRGRSTPGRRGGWMSTWKQPRAATVTIDEGAVWRLEFRTAEIAAVARKVLSGVLQIGERLHEGFGWIAVDPPWLAQVAKAPARSTGAQAPPPPPTAKASDKGRRPWPGAETESLDELVALASRVKPQADFPWKSRTPVRALLRAIAIDGIPSAQALLNTKARPRKRSNGSQIAPQKRWSDLKDWVDTHHVPAFDSARPSQTAFALETMLAYLKEEE